MVKRYYIYDAAGRRVACARSGDAMSVADTIAYAYNARGELTNAVSNVDADYSYSYQYDDIGNRVSSAECGARSAEYVANELNQYTNIIGGPAASEPEFDDDGNQTLIRTATGEWRVTYNGENRPVLWTCLAATGTTATNGDTIAMSYDRQGRRVTKNAERFVYDGYLQIANHHSTPTTSNYNSFTWDPTEPVATRPLTWNSTTLNSQPTTPQPSTFFYTHDGNKNVSEVVAHDGVHAAHYEYAPFGVVTTQCGTSAASNTWRLSSEFAEDDTATVYYNYRYYDPVMGRWLSRDPTGERGASSLLLFVWNAPLSYSDRIGLEKICTNQEPGVKLKDLGVKNEDYPIYGGKDSKGNLIYAAGKVEPGSLSIDICCKCLAKSSGREYSLVVQVKSSFRIRIVKENSDGNSFTRKAGYGKRTKAGYDRTLAHEKVHVKQISNTMNGIFKKLMAGIPEKFPRGECNDKIALAESKKKDAKGDWDIMIMNGNAHSGAEWDEWRKTDGKTEADPELW